MEQSSFKQKMHHEKWPSPIFYTPIFFYYLYNSIKLRKFNYFTVVNPAMKTGGLCAFSKHKTFSLVSKDLLPKTIFLEQKYYTQSDLYHLLKQNQMSFPVVAKPDQGERGFLVNKIDDIDKLHYFLSEKSKVVNFLIQDFIDYPLELGVFALKIDGEWKVTSLTSKKFWSVVGDGVKTVKKLIEESGKEKTKYINVDLNYIPKNGEDFLLEPIGNHCRGTDFVNECSKIDKDIDAVINQALQNTEGLNYCRIDLKTPSWESFKKGQFKIMEINGVSAEPGHIYDRTTPLKTAYKDLFFHWKQMANIAHHELQKTSKSEPFIETVKSVKYHFDRKKQMLEQMLSEEKELIGCEHLDLSKTPEEVLKSFSAKELIKNHDCYISESGYERTTIFENDQCEIVLCHWEPEGGTIFHGHPNKNCWYRCLSGELKEIRRESEEGKVLKVDEIGFINDEIGQHKMRNDSQEQTFTLHYYQKVKIEIKDNH